MVDAADLPARRQPKDNPVAENFDVLWLLARITRINKLENGEY